MTDPRLDPAVERATEQLGASMVGRVTGRIDELPESQPGQRIALAREVANGLDEYVAELEYVEEGGGRDA